MRVLVATRNAGKVREFRRLLGLSGVEVVSIDELSLDVPDVVEDAETFEDNAEKKARELAAATGLLTIGDDSGLEVDALHGAPGVYSARYGGGGGTEANVRKLLGALEDVPEGSRAARFRCVLALVDPTDIDAEVAFGKGVCEGRITREPRGQGGFGYDPVFVPHGEERTMAELSADEKNALSHRARACAALRDALMAQIQSRVTHPGV